MIDDDLPGAGGAEDPVVSRYDRLHIRRVGDADEDDIRLARRVGRRVCPLRPLRQQLCRARFGARENRQRKLGLEQMPGHRSAHDSQSNKCRAGSHGKCCRRNCDAPPLRDFDRPPPNAGERFESLHSLGKEPSPI